MASLLPSSARTRDPAVDVVRGVAIVTMIAANMAPYTLASPHPMPLRIYGSFAAPTFVFLAGMMVGAGGAGAFGRALRRAGELLVIAAAIDVLCWHLMPFTGFDVLYLIGLSLPIAAACASLDLRVHASLAALTIFVTPLVRAKLGYGPLLDDGTPWPVWRRCLVDGWFPMFPWLGVALAGAAYARVRDAIGPRARIFGGAATALAGLAGFLVSPPFLVTRAGYSELFYPPTVRYLAVALGILVVLLDVVPLLRARVSLTVLETFGRASLLLYVAHTAVIAFVLDPFFEPAPLPVFSALYAGHAALMWTLARGKGAFDAWRRVR